MYGSRGTICPSLQFSFPSLTPFVAFFSFDSKIDLYLKAVRKGNAAVGVRGTETIVLSVKKKSTAKLQDSRFNGLSPLTYKQSLKQRSEDNFQIVLGELGYEIQIREAVVRPNCLTILRFKVSSGTSGFQPYNYGGGYQPPAFPVARLRGLPFNCTDIDIFKFFAGLDIVDVLLVNKNGRFSGEAFVVFAGPMQVEFALHRDRQNMGRRYVEVFRCKRQDYYNAVAAEVNYEGIYDNDYQGSPPPSKSKRFSDKDQMEYTEILKMRGLPFSVKKSEILDFFGEFKVVEDRVHIACRPDGKSTGEAYVEFVSAEEAKKAMCKDKMTIGSRYVELFPSTPDEARRAESRSRQ